MNPKIWLVFAIIFVLLVPISFTALQRADHAIVSNYCTGIGVDEVNCRQIMWQLVEVNAQIYNTFAYTFAMLFFGCLIAYIIERFDRKK